MDQKLNNWISETRFSTDDKTWQTNLKELSEDKNVQSKVGIVVNVQDAMGRTALHRMAMKNNTDAIEHLIKFSQEFFGLFNKLNMNLQDNYGNTPLMLAIRNECFDASLLLIQKGCDVNQANRSQQKTDSKVNPILYINPFMQMIEMISKEHDRLTITQIKVMKELIKKCVIKEEYIQTDEYRTMCRRHTDICDSIRKKIGKPFDPTAIYQFENQIINGKQNIITKILNSLPTPTNVKTTPIKFIFSSLLLLYALQIILPLLTVGYNAYQKFDFDNEFELIESTIINSLYLIKELLVNAYNTQSGVALGAVVGLGSIARVDEGMLTIESKIQKNDWKENTVELLKRASVGALTVANTVYYSDEIKDILIPKEDAILPFIRKVMDFISPYAAPITDPISSISPSFAIFITICTFLATAYLFGKKPPNPTNRSQNIGTRTGTRASSPRRNRGGGDKETIAAFQAKFKDDEPEFVEFIDSFIGDIVEQINSSNIFNDKIDVEYIKNLQMDSIEIPKFFYEDLIAKIDNHIEQATKMKEYMKNMKKAEEENVFGIGKQIEAYNQNQIPVGRGGKPKSRRNPKKKKQKKSRRKTKK